MTAGFPAVLSFSLTTLVNTFADRIVAALRRQHARKTVSRAPKCCRPAISASNVSPNARDSGGGGFEDESSERELTGGYGDGG